MVRFPIFIACLMPLIIGTVHALPIPNMNNNLMDPTKPIPQNLNQYVEPTGFNNLYPMMNNKMRTAANPGIAPTQSHNPVAMYLRTTQHTGQRKVVPRGGQSGNVARAATTPAPVANMIITPSNSVVARSGTTSTQPPQSARRVVARSGTNTNVRESRAQPTTTNLSGNNVPALTTEAPTSARCLADYTSCMNGYCERKNLSYNRCYCSARLAQIDSEYRPALDELINKILTLRGTNIWTQQEMYDYWQEKIGQYTGDNSWANLDNALDINWADTESRVRGQQAFMTGHEYCVQHLRGCYYMSSNLRDAYRSEIARDCAVYEQSLQRLKSAAEDMVESLQ